GWPLAAVSLDATGSQASGKGGPGLERSATAGQESSWGRVRGAVEPSHETSRQRGRGKVTFFESLASKETLSACPRLVEDFDGFRSVALLGVAEHVQGDAVVDVLL